MVLSQSLGYLWFVVGFFNPACSARIPKQLLFLIATAITLLLNHEQILQTSDCNFLRERKAHVMTLHNTHVTKCHGVVTPQIYSHGGLRQLPLRVGAGTPLSLPKFLKIVSVRVIIQVVLIGYSIPSSKNV